jgi:hypothetical protein
VTIALWSSLSGGWGPFPRFERPGRVGAHEPLRLELLQRQGPRSVDRARPFSD